MEQTIDLIETEQAWEDAMVQAGIKRYHSAIEKAQKRGEEDSLKTHQRLMVAAMDPLKQKLEEIFGNLKEGKAGRKNKHLAAIEEVKPEVISLLTIKVVLGSLSRRRGFQSVARQLGNVIEDQMIYDNFRSKDKDYFNWVLEENKSSTSKQHSRYSLLGHAKNAGVFAVKLSADTKLAIGTFLIKLFAQETSVIEIKQPSLKEEEVIEISPKTKVYLDRMNYVFEDMFPVYMPMLIEPMDWTNMNDGGYLSRRLTLVKSGLSGYMQDPENLPEQGVLDAINSVQRTAWAINQNVLNVLEELWESRSTLANLPERDDMEVPELPNGLSSDDKEAVKAFKEANPDEWKAWKSTRKVVYAKNRRLMSKRMIIGDCIGLAKQLADKDVFYYVYQADWRGRLYPVCSSSLQPQGADLAKGLLQFAEGKRLGSSGVKWLKRHIANTFGIDKLSWAEREAWVDEHSTQLSLSAIDPLTYRFWMDADKGSKPWQGLAACFAWEQYCRDGEDAVVALPVNLDGSCNGLQHLSSLLLDTFGAEATNCKNHEKPADIYRLVAERVAAQVEADAKVGHEIAQAWEGKVNRSLVKRNVMTVSYGATSFGMLEQIREDLAKELDGKVRDYLGVAEDEKMFPYYKYISDYIQAEIGNVVQAAPLVMKWLKDCALVLAENNLPISWKTPAGFRALQSYKKFDLKRLDTIIGGVRIQARYKQESPVINKGRSGLGISPNVIHSFDAAHCQLTINACAAKGISDFCMIHDSYGTHAADVDTLAVTLREVFVSIYWDNWLQNLYDQFKAQAGDLANQLPQPPKRGTFNIELVKDAGYFFA